MKTQYICLVTLIALFAQFVSYTEAAGIFDSLTGGSKKKNKKKTRDDKRAEYEEIAKEVMADKTVKNTRDTQPQDDPYDASGRVPAPPKGGKKKDKGWIDSMIPESMYDPLPSDDLWQQEWDQAMHNFFPEDQFKFLLPAKKTITWHMDVEQADPVHVRGAYQINQGVEGDREQYRINVVVLDPLKQVIFKKNFMDIGIIAFDTTGQGEYTFTFSSFGLKGGDREVLFMLHEDYLESPNPEYIYPDDWQYKEHHDKVAERGDDNDYMSDSSSSAQKVSEPRVTEEEAAILADQLEDSDTVVMKKSLKGSLDDLKMMSREAKMSLDMQLVHNDNVNVNFTFHVWALVVEIVVVLAIAVLYVWNIQKMVDNKLLL